jgi:hypothetical protein
MEELECLERHGEGVEPDSAMERQTGCAVEDLVGGQQRSADVHGRRSDPEVVGVASIVQRVTSLSARHSELGHGSE